MKKRESFEGRILLVLSLMLISVFVFSVYMYDDFEKNAESGILASAAASVRDFIDENDTVAAFLGIEEDKNETDIESEAAAYIARYNEIYASIK